MSAPGKAGAIQPVEAISKMSCSGDSANAVLSDWRPVYDPWHYVPVLARKPGALRNGAPFKDWVLPAAMERVRRKLAGAEDGNRQMVDILTAVLTDGLPAVEAACAEAIAQGVHSADVVLNILARQRDPGPPATILTPAALTLRHAPIADCARYDNLRRTI